MARTLYSQLEQLAASATYDDTLNPATVGESQVDMEGDLNVLRSVLKNILGETNWFDAPDATIAALAARPDPASSHHLIPVQPQDGTGQSAVSGTATNTYLALPGITTGTAVNSESGNTAGAYAAQLSSQSDWTLHNVVEVRKKNSRARLTTTDGQDVHGFLVIVGATATAFPETIDGDATNGTALRILLKYQDAAGAMQNYALTAADVADGGFDVILLKVNALGSLSRYAFLPGAAFLDVAQDANIGDLTTATGTYLSATPTVVAKLLTLNAELVSLNTDVGDLQTADDNLQTFVGSTGDADASPNYSSVNYIADGQSLVAAMSALDAQVKTNADAIADASIVWTYTALGQNYAINDLVTVPAYVQGTTQGQYARQEYNGTPLIPGATNDYEEVTTAGAAAVPGQVSTSIKAKRSLTNGKYLVSAVAKAS